MDSPTSSDESKKKERDMETEIRELFRSFDKNHDNTICAGELGKVLRCLGMNVSETDVQQIIKELDKNRNGKIEYKEFKAFMQEEMRKSEEPAEQEKAVRMAFRVFDQNGDGFIDVKELKNAMKNLGEPLTDKELADMMKEADMDKDGKINYEGSYHVTEGGLRRMVATVSGWTEVEADENDRQCVVREVDEFRVRQASAVKEWKGGEIKWKAMNDGWAADMEAVEKIMLYEDWDLDGWQITGLYKRSGTVKQWQTNGRYSNNGQLWYWNAT